MSPRWVVVDCEASGLDPARDRLLAVGAVAVRQRRVVLGESFQALLRQETASGPDNILVHGIGADRQRAARVPAEALGAFASFLADGLPVAFHAPFDAALLKRALGAAGLKAPARWLDLAQLAPALFPGRRHRALDEWLGEFGIVPAARHDALGDALATAELFLVLLAEAARQGVEEEKKLRRLQGAARWLPGA